MTRTLKALSVLAVASVLTFGASAAAHAGEVSVLSGATGCCRIMK
ncbi:hypothetical protein QUV83_17495 [Cellulomonas cellasea]|nr:hypothetical protein [Cellulomonas cellasea]MDM8086572.1 hypothetical protein [Cellulomonas cellasea]